MVHLSGSRVIPGVHGKVRSSTERANVLMGGKATQHTIVWDEAGCTTLQDTANDSLAILEIQTLTGNINYKFMLCILTNLRSTMSITLSVITILHTLTCSWQLYCLHTMHLMLFEVHSSSCFDLKQPSPSVACCLYLATCARIRA